MSKCVKDIGHRQVYDILQGRKPRATGGGLWGFQVLACRDVRAMAAGIPVSGMAKGGRVLC